MEFVAEVFGVVGAISRETPQVAGVVPGDLWADLRVVFLRGRQKISALCEVSTSTRAVTFSARTR